MNINTYIDHTLLKADATSEEIEKLCEEAKLYQFKAVCINPSFVKLAKEKLLHSPVKVCTVIGFPLGATTSETKIFETTEALKNGADEIDMVINIGALKEKKEDYILEEIKALAELCHAKKKILKVIFETCLLTDEEIIRASLLSLNAGADFIKTSTGFSREGATPHAVKLMKEAVKDQVKIKASGGIRDLKTAKEYIELGAKRLGTSSGVAIVQGMKSTSAY